MTTAINELIDKIIEHEQQVMQGNCKSEPELVIVSLTAIKYLLNGN